MAITAVSSLKSALLHPISAAPVDYAISLDLSPPSTHVFHYHGSGGFLRECANWDPPPAGSSSPSSKAA
ncbi:unnamed protein product [Linum trigynum]|uniref:Uncharacterized protein n=1 Tax=Linum trigynum TaxID=586398 RepID=A0AAV2CNL7_9ROSI